MARAGAVECGDQLNTLVDGKHAGNRSKPRLIEHYDRPHVRLTTIIQTRIAPCTTLSPQRIQYPRFAHDVSIESPRHALGRHSSCGQDLDMLRGAARVSDICAHASSDRSTGLRTADGPRFRTWV